MLAMRIQSDPRKDRINVLIHEGVSLVDAEGVLSDEWAITIEDRDANGEVRWVTLGLDAFGRKLIVVYTERGEEIRVISARRASPNEGKVYDENRIRFQRR